MSLSSGQAVLIADTEMQSSPGVVFPAENTALSTLSHVRSGFCGPVSGFVGCAILSGAPWAER